MVNLILVEGDQDLEADSLARLGLIETSEAFRGAFQVIRLRTPCTTIASDNEPHGTVAQGTGTRDLVSRYSNLGPYISAAILKTVIRGNSVIVEQATMERYEKEDKVQFRATGAKSELTQRVIFGVSWRV